MVKTAKMELLRTLVSECLSAAAREICKIVERTMAECEEETSCSKWVVDGHRRLLGAAQAHRRGSLQMSATDVKSPSGQQQPAASVNISLCWQPENTVSADCPDINNTQPDSPAGEKDQEILIDITENDVKQECDPSVPLKVLKVKKPFVCPVCLSGFSSKKTMVRHVKRHLEDKSLSYQCQFCDRHFCHRSEFIIHARTHKGPKPYKCQDCEKSFEQRDSLLNHRLKHRKEKSCDRFTDNVAAQFHLSSTLLAGTEDEPDSKQDGSGMKAEFPLTITPYDRSEFDQESLQPLCLYQIQTVADIDKDSSAAVLVDYIKTEPAGAEGGGSYGPTDDQPPLSGSPRDWDEGQTEPKHLNIKNLLPRRTSGKPTDLIVQSGAGTVQKPYKCPCCTKCFSLTKTLIRHVKIHTEDKPYQCQSCGRNFCQKSDLVNHTRIHTGERPYRCQECHKSFAQKGNLVVHMRKHTGERAHQCSEGSCSSGHKSSLDCHMLGHT